MLEGVGTAIYNAGATAANGACQGSRWLGHNIVVLCKDYILPALHTFATKYLFTGVGLGALAFAAGCNLLSGTPLLNQKIAAVVCITAATAAICLGGFTPLLV